MAVVADQYVIELESNIGKVASREEAALKNLDRTIGRAAGDVAKLNKELGGAGAALQKATEGRNGIVNVSEVRTAQKEVARIQGALGKSQENLAALQGARPKFDQLAELSRQRSAEASLSKQRAADQKEQARLADRATKEAARAQANRERESKKSSKKAMEQYKALQEATSAAALVAPFAAAAGVIAGIIGAIAALTAAYLSFAFAAASAARNQKILGEALTGSGAGGEEFSAVVNQLARQIPLAKDRIREMARELSLAKLGGRDLQATLVAMGTVASAVGDQGASAIKAIAEQSRAARRFTLGPRDLFGEFASLSGTGLKKADILGALAEQLGTSIPAVEKRLLQGGIALDKGLLALEAAAKKRFGRTITAQMLDFNVQISKAQEALAGMFGDLNLDPVLRGLKEFLSILDTSTVTGDALKFLLTTGLQTFIDSLEVAGPIAKKFFQGLIIGALRAYITLKPVYNQVRDFFGFTPSEGGLQDALAAGEVAFYAMAAAAALVGASLLLAFSPFIIVGYLVYGAIKMMSSALEVLFTVGGLVVDALGEAWDAVKALDFGELGLLVVNGIVGGITGGAGRAIEAIGSLGKSMISAFKASVDSHSPSRLFHREGLNIDAGLEGGVDAGAPDVHRAIEGLGEARPSEAASGGAGSGGGRGLTIGSLTIGSIVMGDGKPAEADVDSMVRASFRRMLEEIRESGQVPEAA